VTPDPITIIENALHAHGRTVKRAGDKLTAQCPAHDDSSPSLSVGLGNQRDAVVHCHAGCRPDDIMDALGVKWTDLGPTEPADDTIREWVYTDEHGRPLFKVVRRPGKRFTQHAMDVVTGEWLPTLGKARRVIYRLPEVTAAAKAGETIWIAEGEKDVDALVRAGVVATCNPGGAKKWRDDYARHLKGAAEVVIVADRDTPGLEHAEQVACSLNGTKWRVVQAAVGKDAYDHLSGGKTLDEFVPLNGTDGATEPAWPDAIPLGETHTSVVFPVDALPPDVAAHVRAVAGEMQVAADLPAMLAIAAMAAAISRRWRASLIPGGWNEPTNVYIVIALPPSAGKSPVVNRMFGAFYDYEQNVRPVIEMQRESVELKQRIITKQMKRAEDKGDVTEAQIALDELRALKLPVVPRLIADDATPEALQILLADQGENLALISTEGGPFDIMAGRYSDRANLDVYLKAWGGDPLRVDRVGRASLTMQSPTLTIGLTVQPSVIESLARTAEFKGRGLSARFMYAIPVDFVGTRDYINPPPPNQQARAAYDRRLGDLIADDADPQSVSFSDDALATFKRWMQRIEERRRPDGDLRPLAEWSTKMVSTVARVAALLAVWERSTEIDVDHIERAITIGAYWIDHARVVHEMWEVDDRIAGARAVLDWARQRELSEFSVRDVHASLRKRFPAVEDVRPALMILTERGWIRPLFDGPLVLGVRGKESPRFAVRSADSVDNSDLDGKSAQVVDHVDHVPKSVFEDLSLSLIPATETRHSAHGPHGTQLADLPPDPTASESPQSVADDYDPAEDPF
jgi:putative DNA primase/helicase